MDPVLEKILAVKRAHPYLEEQTIEELRSESAAAGAALPLPEGTVLEAVSAGGVPAEWITAPNAATDRCFLFIHGGGYYRGSVATTRSTSARISASTNARVLSIDYRLAPEHPFPGALDDTLAAYRWLLDQGADAARTMVGGVSAGGGLTLALLLALRDAGERLPAGAVPMSPWTDLTQSGASFQDNAERDPVISKAYLDRMSKYYLGGTDPSTPYASPLYGDLTGLPALLVQVGSGETMRDDSVAFAEKARASGVDVVLEQWPDMFHGWHGSAHVLDDARRAIERIGEFYREHIGTR